ncbi:MAG: D-alanyl-D-alanine carboxypeptidase/D-alanyl-D-alanine-endopeptidase, partial [Phycisphaeraceae bacterium]|nr:D-alanyl-D-alanine carboxypeptidase/D-alanyl-D-alanine-endopeptidase [Phycisphaeraceae bacterium]
LQATRPMIPASNMKLITSAAALSTLGKDFAFTTRLLQYGSELMIVGDGDPAFGDPVLLAERNMDTDDPVDRWAEAVLAAGLGRVDRLVVNDRVFDHTERVHKHWPDDQLDKWYCAQVAAINYNNNCIDLFAEPTSAGQPPRIDTLPSLAPVILDNRVKTGKSNAFWAARAKGTNRIVLRGTVRTSLPARIQVTVDDPAMFFGKLLQRRIEARKKSDGTPRLRVDQVVRIGTGETAPGAKGRLLIEHRTPIEKILLRCNRDSQNLFAESMIRRLGHQITSQPGTWSNGSAAVRMFLSRVLKADAATVVVDDGSGLSRHNRVSAAALVRVLRHMHGSKKLSGIYLDSLASPALKRGTLRRRFRSGIDISKLLGGRYLLVKTSTGNVRQRPTTNSKVVATCARHEAVRIIGSQGNWFQIQPLDSKKTGGWMHRNILTDEYFLRGSIRAKSGYINGVVALSGYLSRGRRTIAFSMILNDYKRSASSGKRLIDQTLLWLDKHLFDQEAESELKKLLASLEAARKLPEGNPRQRALLAVRSDLLLLIQRYAGTPAARKAEQNLALVTPP